VIQPSASLLRSASAGALLHLVRTGEATTRADLATLTGLARSTVSQRVDLLIDTGLLLQAGEAPLTGGRPPMKLAFNSEAGVILAADLGATHARLAVTDLTAASLAEVAEDVEIARGPDEVLSWVTERFTELLERAHRTPHDVWGIGVGLPGPVEFAAGRAVSPPIMPGWDGFSVSDALAPYYDDALVLVDNDVNIMALGEYWTAYREEVDDLLFIKVGTGIGAGLISSGAIQRGAQGSAGDMGHVQVAGASDALCRCGNIGCLEAVAGGGAIAGQLRTLGYAAQTSRDVVRLVRSGNPDAARLVREAGRKLGDMLATAVNLLNPAVIVLGGTVAQAHEQLLAGVREVIYQRSLPLATRHLLIARSTLDDRAGISGAAVMLIEHLLDPVRVEQLVADLEARVASTTST
jgi:predicted NBD/HSP70 family sugar kinase